MKVGKILSRTFPIFILLVTENENDIVTEPAFKQNPCCKEIGAIRAALQNCKVFDDCNDTGVLCDRPISSRLNLKLHWLSYSLLE